VLLIAKWVLPIESEPIENGAILVEGSEIKAVGRFEELATTYGVKERIDFGNAVILPGFIDLHTHLEFSVFRGVCDDLGYSQWKIQLTEKSSRMTTQDWLDSAYLGALEAIQSGITCIADITNTGASLKAALVAGLRGVIFCEVTGMDHTKLSQVMRKAKKTLDKWRDLTSGSLLKIGISPHSPYTVAPPLFKKVSDLARKERLPVCIHLAGSRDEYNFVKYGSSPLANEYRDLVGWGHILWQPMGVSPVKYIEQWDLFEVENVLAVHCVQVSEEDIDIFRKYDVAIAHCPKCGAKLGMGIAPLTSFIHHKLRVGIGTDSPASNNTMDVFDEMRIGVLLQRGLAQSVDTLSAERFVRFATLGGAEALQLSEKIGSLKPGKQADIIAVDLSHSHQIPAGDPYSALVYTANQENVIFSMVGGKILYRSGKHYTLNEQEILTKIGPIRAKLC
jgi:5-methylthioadenosine/S-adenosylhomocysteine deaminase